MPMRSQQIDLEFDEPTGNGFVRVGGDAYPVDAGGVESCRIAISKVPTGKDSHSEEYSFALLTDAEAVQLRDVLVVWLHRYDQAPAPNTPEHPPR